MTAEHLGSPALSFTGVGIGLQDSRTLFGFSVRGPGFKEEALLV